MKLTAPILQAGTGCTTARALMWLPPLQEACDVFSINTPARLAMFLAQLGHESGRLVWVKEIWGPAQVPAQVTYERDPAAPWPRTAEEAKLAQFARNRKAFGLGNVLRGDGRRFSGRGLIQLTGRANYGRFRDGVRRVLPDAPDFEAQPELVELPRWAAMSAGWFWSDKGLNALADTGQFEAVTRRINGGLNGLADRQQLWAGARAAIGALA